MPLSGLCSAALVNPMTKRDFAQREAGELNRLMASDQLTGIWTAVVQKAVWRTGLEADWVYRLIQNYVRKHRLAQNAANIADLEDDWVSAHAGFRLIDGKISADPGPMCVFSVQTFTPYGTKTPFFIYGDESSKAILIVTLSSLPRFYARQISSSGARVARGVPNLANE